MNYYAAPMEGITGYIWRKAHHRYYPGIQKYYTPFLSPKKKRGWTSREKAEILPDHNDGIPLVPQVLTSSSGDFVHMAERLSLLGYKELNLNLGCPSGTVVSKGKGCGFLKDPADLQTFFDQVFEETARKNIRIQISVKSRLGLERPEEIEKLMDIYNQFPISELILHARVREDMYKKPARKEIFEQAFSHSLHPVCYNGDVFSVRDADDMALRCPGLDRIMLGRGLIANPQLQEMIEKNTKKDLYRLKMYHDDICLGYEEIMSGDRNVLFKMKELWNYMFLEFPDSLKTAKKIRKTTSLSAYRTIIEEWFSSQIACVEM